MTKIWIVEDDDSIRSCLESFLKFEGFPVEAFAEGEVAIQKASENPTDFWADLVFLDLYTDAMPAFEFVQCLKDLATRFKQRMPTICVISGAIDIEKASQSLNADSFFQKPFEILDLIQYAKQVPSQIAAIKAS